MHWVPLSMLRRIFQFRIIVCTYMDTVRIVKQTSRAMWSDTFSVYAKIQCYSNKDILLQKEQLIVLIFLIYRSPC